MTLIAGRKMKRSSKKVLVVATVIYLVTWIGGLIVYPRDMARRAQEQHSYALDAQRKLAERSEDMRKFVAEHPAASPAGPTTEFHWCFPLLPAVLVVYSDYNIGPLNGNGGLRLVLYFGTGTIETPAFIGWVS